MGPVEEAVRAKLSAFAPNHLVVANESAKHNVPSGSETHFKVVIISDAFADRKLLERHRMVNEALAEELAG